MSIIMIVIGVAFPLIAVCLAVYRRPPVTVRPGCDPPCPAHAVRCLPFPGSPQCSDFTICRQLCPSITTHAVSPLPHAPADTGRGPAYAHRLSGLLVKSERPDAIPGNSVPVKRDGAAEELAQVVPIEVSAVVEFPHQSSRIESVT